MKDPFALQMISSRQNTIFKEALQLKEGRERRKQRRFLIEGYREISRAIEAKEQIEQLFFAEDLFLGANEPALIAQLHADSCYFHRIDPQLFSILSYRDRPDGLIAVAKEKERPLEELRKILHQEELLLLVAESIEKPGNLGSMIRSCDGVGASAVIVVDSVTDLLNPNAIRSSVGTIFTVPTFQLTMAALLQELTLHHVPLIASTPAATTLYSDYPFPRKVAIGVGSEQLGLSEASLKAAQERVFIPMLGHADSLNVSVATALLLYEIRRQHPISR